MAKTASTAEEKDPVISGEKLEGLTGLTDRRHRQLAKEGYFPNPERGSYQLTPTLKGLFKYFREVRLKDSTTMAAEKLRKLKEEADRVALENERTRGKLVEVEAVYKHFEGIFVSFRARVLASSLSNEEKDELLNDLRKLKARDISERESPGENSTEVVGDPAAAAAV